MTWVSIPFGTAAGLGWFGPPRIALEAELALACTLARAPEPWNDRF